MKEKVKVPGVMDDKEFILTIRRMIEEAIQKEYKKTSVMNAISQTWKDIAKNDKIKIELTVVEQDFFEKVDLFFSEYGQAFVSQAIRNGNALSRNNEKEITEKEYNSEYANSILDSFIKFTKSVFCTFCREDTITQANVKKYNNKLWGSYEICNLYSVSFVLSNFFLVDGKLVYAKEKNECEDIRLFSIENNENYKQFIEKYSFKKVIVAEVAMKLIWIVSNCY